MSDDVKEDTASIHPDDAPTASSTVLELSGPPPPTGTLEPTSETGFDEVVMALEDGRKVQWDPDDMPIYDAIQAKMIPHDHRVRYFQARERGKQLAKFETEKPMVDSPLLGVIGGTARSRNKIRERAGWHQTWKRDDEIAQALEAGYVHIRQQKKSDSYAPGKEKGEITRRETFGSPKTIAIYAMEIPELVHRKHLLAISYKSKTRGVEKRAAAAEYLKETTGATITTGEEVTALEEWHEKRATQ